MSQILVKFNAGRVAVIFLTAVLLLGIILGIQKGRAMASAESVRESVMAIQKGLGYFFEDNLRFPSVEEIFDTNFLLTYFSGIPDNLSNNSVCAQNFVYQRPTSGYYRLDFCLAAGLNQYRKGWNSTGE